METATQARLVIDHRQNHARQFSAMIMKELQDFIPDGCRAFAEHRLFDLAYNADLQCTTAETRRLADAMKRIGTT